VKLEIRVGLLVAAAVAIALAMVLLIGQFSWFQRFYTIYADFTDIETLNADSPVLLAGLKVGRVSDVRLSGEKVRVAMLIKEGVPIRADSPITITTGLILGETYVRINIGSPTALLLEDGAIVQGTDPVSTDRLIETVQGVAQRMDTLTTSVSEVLGESEKADLREVIAAMRRITENLDRITGDNTDDVRETILAYKQVASDLSENLNRLSENTLDLVTKLNEVVDENRADVRDATESFSQVGPKLDETLGKLDRIANRIETGEGTIGKLVTEETIYDDARLALGDARDAFVSVEQAAKGAEDFLAPAAGAARKAQELRLMWLVGLDQDVTQSFGRADAGLKLQTSDKKYYVIGANWLNADDDEDEDKDGERDKISYDGFMGYSFGLPNTYFRFGMMEGGGGVGVEHYLASDKLRLTLDGFVNEADTQAKMGAEYWFNDNLAMRVGLHRVPDEPAVRLGVRVEFQDDDLKTLLSTFR
jgi:phospholipid/cholesterol/gamma-HCH transport system substrate-binding protein